MMLTRSSIAAAVVLVMVALTAGSAGATYPGADGAIAFAGATFTPPDLNGADVFAINERGDINSLTGCTKGYSEPDWSPDGRQLAVVDAQDPFAPGIYVAALAREPRFVTTGVDPAWSPDGHRIAFSNQGDLWEVGADGGGLRNLTSTPELEEDWPAWAPDGSRLVFAAGQGAALRQLYVMNADGTDRVQLTEPDPYTAYTQDVAPDWSPDGSRIVYEHRVFHRSGRMGQGLRTIEPDGSADAGFGDASQMPANLGHPSWAPSGARVAFESLDRGIWTVNTYGRDLHPVLQAGGAAVGVGAGAQPDWGPAVPVADQFCLGQKTKAASFKGVSLTPNQRAVEWMFRCHAPPTKRCRALLRLRRRSGELGRNDVRVPGGVISTVTVRLKPFALRALRRRGQLRVRVIADVSYRVNQTHKALSRDSRLLVLVYDR